MSSLSGPQKNPSTPVTRPKTSIRKDENTEMKPIHRQLGSPLGGHPDRARALLGPGYSDPHYHGALVYKPVSLIIG